MNYRDAGRLTEALPLLEEAYRASREHARRSAGSRRELLDAYVRAGQPDKAAALARELLAEGRAAMPADSPQLAGLLAQTGVGPPGRQGVGRGRADPPRVPGHPREGRARRLDDVQHRSMLGGALLGQKKYAEAEPLLLAGYEGMKARADKIPPQGKDPPRRGPRPAHRAGRGDGQGRRGEDVEGRAGEAARCRPRSRQPERR